MFIRGLLLPVDSGVLFFVFCLFFFKEEDKEWKLLLIHLFYLYKRGIKVKQGFFFLKKKEKRTYFMLIECIVQFPCLLFIAETLSLCSLF